MSGVPVRIWDLPVRLVHWAMFVLVIVSWITAENHWPAAHRLAGYSVLSLLLFRFYWGWRGSTTARFSHFVRGPRAVGRYVRLLFTGDAGNRVGHNPIGGWSVLILLSLLLLQSTLGLLSVEEYGIESGPLATHVSFETGRKIAGLHAVVFDILVFFIGVHIAAVLLHLLVKRDNLIGPMLSGMKQEAGGERPVLEFVGRRHALLAAGVCCAIVAVLVLVAGA